MQLPESLDHPESWDQQSFAPFEPIGSLENDTTYQCFEKIRTSCKYYNLPPPGDHSHVTRNDNCCNIIHINARSLLSEDKFAEFKLLIHNTGCNWSIICVSETWLFKELEGKRQLEGYFCFFDSRSNGVRGGVAIYIRNDITKQIKMLHNNMSCSESILLECQLKNNLHIIICQIYRPPNTSINTFIEEFNNTL